MITYSDLANSANEIWSYSWGGNTVRDYATAFALFLGIFIAFKVFKSLIVKKLEKLAKKTTNKFDDEVIKALEDVSAWFYYIVALYIPLKMISTYPEIDYVLEVIFVIAVAFELVKVAQKVVEFGLSLAANRAGDRAASATTFSGIKVMVKVVLWSITFLLVLSNLGVNVSSLVASMGIGGIAIALALQNILTDMFSSFSIYFDKPFQVGDYIVVGSDEGTVKKIGLKTTRITALRGEELVISNKELTTARVQNLKKLKSRRVSQAIGVVYQTTPEKLEMVNEIVKKSCDAVEEIEFDRCNLKGFGDFSLNFEIVYFALTADYKEYMALQEKVNMGIINHFAKEKIEFAYPTQLVYVNKD